MAERHDHESDTAWAEFKKSLPALHDEQRRAEAQRRASGIDKESVVEGLRETPRPPVPEDTEWIARLAAEERAERAVSARPVNAPRQRELEIGQTFQQYLDSRIAEYVEEDPNLDIGDLREQFLGAIEQYGFTAADVIPGTFVETMRKHLL